MDNRIGCTWRLGVVLSVLTLFGAGSVLSYANAETIHMYVQPMPRQWQTDYGDILSQATQYWQKSIPGTEFETVTYLDKADVVVEWSSQNGQGTLGYYSENTANDYGKPVMAITLGFFEDGKWQLVPANVVLQVTEHEFGHLLGIQHSTNPSDVMYPTVDDYESANAIDQNVPKSTHFDWHANSEKYQSMATEKITPLQAKIDDAKVLLSSKSYGTKVASDILDDSWMSYWWAVKYLDMAEKAQTDGGAFVLTSDFQNSYLQFKSSYDYTKKVDEKLQQITDLIAKADGLS